MKKWVVITGVFVGNWLVVPIISENTSFYDGFFIGIIAAVIILVAYKALEYLKI